VTKTKAATIAINGVTSAVHTRGGGSDGGNKDGNGEAAGGMACVCAGK